MNLQVLLRLYSELEFDVGTIIQAVEQRLQLHPRN